MTEAGRRRNHGRQERGRGRPEPRRRPRGRQRATLSLDLVVDTAIATLDAHGESGLTLRGLAAQLESGVASLYWYAASREQLMEIVADEVLGYALSEYARLLDDDPAVATTARGEAPYVADPSTSSDTAAALGTLRVFVLCMWQQMAEHPWLAVQLLRSEPNMPNSLRCWETIGRQLARMELALAEQFPASLAVANFASGVGAEVAMRSGGSAPVPAAESAEVAQGMDEQISEWEELDAGEFTFVRSILSEFRGHDDRSQFIAGLDLLLSGIERQTWKNG